MPGEISLRAFVIITETADMVTTDLGACEWFVWDLRRSNLIDRGRLDQVIGEFLEKNPRAEPPALAEYLVGQGILTQFQADRLLQGKTQGFVLGPYTLMDALGTGSMGTVYKAQSKTDNQWYAIKVLPRRSMWNVRIARRKVRAFEQCKHSAVVPFVDVGTAGGMHYLTWPLVEGETLHKLVEREGKLRADAAAQYALQVAEGLQACQKENLIHGLLKPSNILVGADQQVRILDFGIGCLLAETEGESLVDTMSTANSVASGLDCASPESIMDPTNLTSAGDQYSLGCTLYYCLTGRYPFPDGSAAEKMMAHQLKQPEPISVFSPEVPPDLVEVVERLMQKKPENRYANMADAMEALRPFARMASVVPKPFLRANQLRDRAPATARPHSAPLNDTPRPAAPAAIHSNTAAPAAVHSNIVAPASPSRPAVVEATPAAPEIIIAEPAPLPDRSTFAAPEVKTPSASWEDRLGPLGIAIGAIVACILAWLLTWHLF
jgi:serine/threonine-protein kinase